MIEEFKLFWAHVRLTWFCFRNHKYRVAIYSDERGRTLALSAYGGPQLWEIIFYKRPGEWIAKRSTWHV